MGELHEVDLYCDGACRGNPGLGGYGAILVCDGVEKEISGVVEQTTNNRMELLAAIKGFEVLTELCRVHVVTDSQYLHKGMTEWIHGWRRRGWRTSSKSPVLNRDLWERLSELAEGHEVTWEWVRGHEGHVYNERCDRLANRAMDEYSGRSGGRGKERRRW